MEIGDFQRLFRYDAWANREVLAALHAIGNAPERSVELLAHMAGAGNVWLARLKQEQPPLAIWPQLSLTECERYLLTLESAWPEQLDKLGLSSLAENVEYRNSRGEEFSTSVADVLMQVLMHGTYHRGQIAMDMRAHGFTPVLTDYIAAERKGVFSALSS